MPERITLYEVIQILAGVKRWREENEILKHISIRESSFNYVIERLQKNSYILRTPEGFKLTKKGEEFLSLYKDIIIEFRAVERSTYSRKYEILSDMDVINEFSRILEERPPPRRELDQYYMTTDSAINKVFIVMSYLRKFNCKRVLLLGDDDLTSIGLAFLNSDIEIDVIELGENIFKYISSLKEKYNLKNLNIIKGDIFKINPPSKKYDCVVFDPPYAFKGAEKFCKFASKSCNDKNISLIMTILPIRETIDWTLSLLALIERTLMKEGFIVLDIIKDIFQYEGNDRLLSSFVCFIKKKFVIEKKRKRKYWWDILQGRENINIPEVEVNL